MGTLSPAGGSPPQVFPWSVEIQLAADVDVNPADIPIYAANCPAKCIVAGVLFTGAGAGVGTGAGELSTGPDALSSGFASAAALSQTMGVGTGKFVDVGGTMNLKVDNRSEWEGSLVVTLLPIV
jgi:hypothetical protein